MQSFLLQCLRGEAQPTDLDDFIDRWHQDTLTTKPLHTYLGLSHSEYFRWLEYSTSMTDIISARKEWAKQPQRGFYRYSLSKAAADYEFVEIGFGLYDLLDGGTTGEMEVIWEKLASRNELTPRLQIWGEGWQSLATFVDIIQAMGTLQCTKSAGELITEPEITELLIEQGFLDMTDYP